VKLAAILFLIWAIVVVALIWFGCKVHTFRKRRGSLPQDESEYNWDE
jgi:hypothetical protein